MEYIISKQVLGSGISIGANVKEGLGAKIRRDFLKKPLKQSIVKTTKIYLKIIDN